MAARGYAVLLPDPGLSTGYGHDSVGRGSRRPGARPFADLMAITAPPPPGFGTIIGTRTHGDGRFVRRLHGELDASTARCRFKAIVSQPRSLWALDQMFGTTDMPGLRAHVRRPAHHPQALPGDSPTITSPRSAPPHSTGTRTTAPVPIAGRPSLRHNASTSRGGPRREAPCTSLTRTTGPLAPATRWSGTRQCSRSSPPTSSASPGTAPTSSNPPPLLIAAFHGSWTCSCWRRAPSLGRWGRK
jgi:hypothetical protein